MTPPDPDPSARRGLGRLHHGGQWLLLLLLSAGAATLLELAELPAALLLGPMIGGIFIGVGGGGIRLPRLSYMAAQSIVGCLIARAITPQIVGTFAQDWPLFLAVVASTILASTGLGWLMSRWRVLPGTTGLWGSSPGAASVMVVMGEAYGADIRLIAFMQYARVICVAVSASVVSRLWMEGGGGVQRAPDWFPAIPAGPFAATLALAALGAIAGRLLRLPAGAMTGPLLAGAVLHAGGFMQQVWLPQWLLAIAYGIVGWTIGLRFNRVVLGHALRALPVILASIVALMAFCGGTAFILVKTTGVDPLSAYLATSPGGLDSIAIIAASAKVDIPFVMALQTVRFCLVMITSPPLARLLARGTLGGDGGGR